MNILKQSMDSIFQNSPVDVEKLCFREHFSSWKELPIIKVTFLLSGFSNLIRRGPRFIDSPSSSLFRRFLLLSPSKSSILKKEKKWGTGNRGTEDIKVMDKWWWWKNCLERILKACLSFWKTAFTFATRQLWRLSRGFSVLLPPTQTPTRNNTLNNCH